MLLGKQVDDDRRSGESFEGCRQLWHPPLGERAERREARTHLQPVVGNRVGCAHESEQTGDDDDAVERSGALRRGERGDVEVVPHDSRVALPRRKCRRAAERSVGHRCANEVLTFDAEELRVTTLDLCETSGDLVAVCTELSTERPARWLPCDFRHAALGLAFRRREEDDIRRSWGGGRRHDPKVCLTDDYPERMARVKPVQDWATDFDHADPAYNENAHQIWDTLRATCPVAHTDRYGGAWLPVRHDDVAAVARDTDSFSSEGAVLANRPPAEERISLAPIGAAPPITSDPPFHADARRLLLPAFSPQVIAGWEPEVRRLCNELLDRMGDADVVDAAVQYAQHIPVYVIARMLGLPVEDSDYFRETVHLVLEEIGAEFGERQGGFEKLDAYLLAHVEDHIENPRDDLIGFLLNARIFDRPLETQHIVGTIVLLLVAGIDTTWSSIGSSIWHLAQHPDDLARLVSEPELMPTAIEELLRAYAPVTMARMIAKDAEIGGCPVKAGENVLLAFPAANRDPEAFPDADRVIIDREHNRHLAFGLGIHRCLGSNLARLELRVAVEEFIRRFPKFELADESAVTWSLGQVRGPRQLPVRVLQRS